MANTESFTADIVSVVIAVIVVAAVAVPIINGMVGKDGYAADGTTPQEGATYPIQDGTMLATIVQILPVFLVLAVLMMIVYLFITKKRF